jgi:hypothetical protein
LVAPAAYVEDVKQAENKKASNEIINSLQKEG